MDKARAGPNVAVFVLAKNEQPNIGRCLDSLKSSSWHVYVLDSGSTDETRRIVGEHESVELKNYVYTSHCDAYNQITSQLAAGYKHVIVLDADMVIPSDLQVELNQCLTEHESVYDVYESHVLMYVEGKPLRYGSLYPPKPFVFAVGRTYFESAGHGEALIAGVRIKRLKLRLVHDDRKSYGTYLNTQLRYAKKLSERKLEGKVTGRDKIRISTPLLVIAVPLVTYLLKAGFLSGKQGLVYALDRLIAEAIMYRQSLVNDAKKE